MSIFISIRSALFYLFMFSSYMSIAQGADKEREYTRQREAAARAADERAHIAAAGKNNAPAQSSWGSATGVLGRVGHYNVISPERAAEIRAIEEKTKAEFRRQDDRAKRYGIATAPYIDFFQASGLYDLEEARSITYRTLDANDGEFTLSKSAQFNLNSAASFKQFNATFATADFDKLSALALNFSVATAKSVYALQSLAVRFPERQVDIDMALISTLQGLYGSKKFSSLPRPSYSYKGVNPKQAIYDKLDSLFFRLARKYPDSLGAAIDEEYASNGYVLAINYAREQGRKAEAKLLALQEEYIALPSKDIRTRAGDCKELIGNKGLSFVKSIASTHGLHPEDILLMGFNKEQAYAPDAITFRQSLFSIYKPDAKDPFSKPFAEMIRQLAAEEVPAAMNVYALRIAQGWTDQDVAESVVWLRKAAVKGSADAKANLGEICKFNIKGLINWCKNPQ